MYFCGSLGFKYCLYKSYINNESLQGKGMEIKNANGTSWQFHHHITAQTMRRTAITPLLIMGVPKLIVRKISGHAPGSKEFYRYVSIAQEYLNNEVQTAYKKLVNEHRYLPKKST